MKPFLTLVTTITVLLFSQSSFSQKDKDIPAWGKIEKADLEMKECDFDKEAEAMILLEKGEIEYMKGSRSDFALKKDTRTRIKILKEKGFNHADVKITFYSDGSYEKLTDIDAVTYNLDASGKIVETKVDKKSFYRQKADANHTMITFTFPEVKVGSILEYRYTIIREAFTRIDPWSFQDRIPTRVSSFFISFPEYFRFVTNAQTSFPMDNKTEDNFGNLSIGGENIRYKTTNHTYKMKNVPALKFEPYMGSARDYLQRIDFQLSEVIYPNQAPVDYRNTWPRLVEDLLKSEYFGDQIKKNLSLGDELQLQLKIAKTPTDKLLTIYRYVQSTMEWDGNEDYYCESAKDCWNKKKGTSGDINIILLNLLRDAGIECYPLLGSTRDHGRVISAYPLLRQFNTLLVYAQIGDNSYILDASDKYNPAGLIPYNVLGSDAFVVDAQKSGFVTLWDNRSVHKNIISIAGGIEEEGVLKGEANIYSYDYAKNPRVKTHKEGNDKFITKWLTGETTAMKVEGLEVKNANKDSLSLEQKFKFSVPVEGSGDYKYFKLNLFTGLDKNPFISDKRQTNIEFGYNQYHMMVGSITIPTGYQFEELPKNMMLIMPDTSIVFRRVLEASGDRLNYRVTLEFKRPFYEAGEYEEFKEFYKKLFANLNEQIVYKKKAVPKP